MWLIHLYQNWEGNVWSCVSWYHRKWLTQGTPQALRLCTGKITQGLLTDTDIDLSFTLVVDSYGIKYTNKKDAEHLISALQTKYEVTQDCTGGIYFVIKLKWDYKKRQLDISMTRYVKDALHKFQKPTRTRPHHSPHKWTAPKYESTALQLEHPEDDYLELNPEEAKKVQQSVGTFLYYTRAVDPTMLVALNTISSQQSKSTQETAKKLVQILNYAATYPDAITRYHDSRMTLHMHSDASFLSALGAKIRAGGYHYLIETSSDPNKIPPHTPLPQWTNKCGIHNNEKRFSKWNESGTWSIICELSERADLKISLEEMVHHQPPTPVVTDSATINGFVNDNIRQRQSRATDMRFYGVCNRVIQGHYLLYWEREKDNLADYFSKHHPTKHHRAINGIYVVPTANYIKHAATRYLAT